METPYRIELMSADFSEDFGLDERIFYCIFEPHKFTYCQHLFERMIMLERETRKMFRQLLKMAFDGHCDSDKVCLVIYHDDLKENIIVSLRDISTFTEDTIIQHIEDEELSASKPFKFRFTIICN